MTAFGTTALEWEAAIRVDCLCPWGEVGAPRELTEGASLYRCFMVELLTWRVGSLGVGSDR